MKKLLLLFTAIIFLFTQCRRDEKAFWDAQIKGPIVNSSLTIDDLLQSDLLQSNPDSSLKLVYNQNLANLVIDSLFNFRDTVVTFGASLQSLDLEDITIRESVTLEEMAANDPTMATLINIFHGNEVQTPEFLVDEAIENPISNSEYFESMTLEEAKIRFTFENNLPIEIADVIFELRNADNLGGEVVYRDTFPSIPPNTTIKDSAYITNQVIKSDLVGSLISMTVLEPSEAVLIDKFDSLVATIEILDVKPIEATAIWPAQDLIDTNSIVTFNPDQVFKLKDMWVRQGEVVLEAFSSLEDTLYVTYTLPNLIRDTTTFEPFVIDTFIPPASGNNYGRVEQRFDIKDYYFLLNGYGIETHDFTVIDYNNNGIDDQDTINAFFQNMKGRIQYTGEMKTLKKSDTLFIRAGLVDVLPEYTTGYAGEQTQQIGPANVPISVFNRVTSGAIDLEDVDMDIEINNGFGADANVEFNLIKGTNNRTDNEVTLSGTPINGLINISKATRTFNAMMAPPVSASLSTIQLNGSNSNVQDFAENLPNSIEYDISFTLNPGLGNLSAIEIADNPPNFIYYDEGLNANLNMEIPLSFMADSLLLMDTLDYNYFGKTDDYNNGSFGLVINNDFPFDAYVDLLILDQNDNFVDTLITNGFIERAVFNLGDTRISSSTESVISFNVSKERLQNLIDGKKIVARFGFHTNNLPSGSNQHVKIFSDYAIHLILTGDVNITLSN